MYPSMPGRIGRVDVWGLFEQWVLVQDRANKERMTHLMVQDVQDLLDQVTTNSTFDDE